MVFGLSHMISGHNSLNASATMETLEEVVKGLVDDVTVARFKVGITWNPPHRWANDKYGYKMNYSRMHLLLVDQSPSKCGLYEAYLIKMFKKHAKIDNVKIGDDNRQDVAPHYVYIVTKLVGFETTRWTADSITVCPACGNRRGGGNSYTCLCDEA